MNFFLHPCKPKHSAGVSLTLFHLFCTLGVTYPLKLSAFQQDILNPLKWSVVVHCDYELTFIAQMEVHMLLTTFRVSSEGKRLNHFLPALALLGLKDEFIGIC